MKQAKIILARYKKGVMNKEQVISYLGVCGMDASAKAYIINNL